MDRNYLLTYLKDGYAQFDWFESLEEMQDFIDRIKPDDIYETQRIIATEEVEVKFNKPVK
jgi:hypothetical protein